MKDAKRASETFDKIAEHFDKTRKWPWDVVVEFLEDLDGRLLDLGCGNGRHAKEALKKGLDVVGVDASYEILKIARKKVVEDGDWVRGGFKRLPFKEESFDNILFIAGIHHLKTGRVEALEEAKRILKSQGKLLVSSWARELDRWDLDEDERDIIVPWHREDGKVIDRFYHLYRLDELKEDVEKAGLSIRDSFHKDGNNYVIARK